MSQKLCIGLALLLSSGEVFNYNYDSAARLQREIRTLGNVSHTTTYGYDALGNRASMTVDEDTVAWVF